MLSNSLKLIPCPSILHEDFYLKGHYFIKFTLGYFRSHILNEYGFTVFDKRRNLYEKISKKEYYDSKKELENSSNLKAKGVQLSLF